MLGTSRVCQHSTIDVDFGAALRECYPANPPTHRDDFGGNRNPNIHPFVETPVSQPQCLRTGSRVISSRSGAGRQPARLLRASGLVVAGGTLSLAPADGWPSEGDKRDSKSLPDGCTTRATTRRRVRPKLGWTSSAMPSMSCATAWISDGARVVLYSKAEIGPWKNLTACGHFAPEPASGTRPGGHLITSLQKPTLCRRRR